jgi:hypothetical protein
LLQALGGALSDSNKRKAQVEEPAPSEEDPSAFTGLLLPTTYQAKIDSVSGGAGIAAATGAGNFFLAARVEACSCIEFFASHV